MLLLQPPTQATKESTALPFKAYEPTIEIKDRRSRPVFVEASYTIETGEAERIAVDWTARGGEGGSTRKPKYLTYLHVWINSIVPLVLSNLQSQRAAVQMLHDRIQLLVQYVTSVIAGIFLCHRLTMISQTTSRQSQPRPFSTSFLVSITFITPCFRRF